MTVNIQSRQGLDHMNHIPGFDNLIHD